MLAEHRVNDANEGLVAVEQTVASGRHVMPLGGPRIERAGRADGYTR
jgi:hypothetical protein